MVRTFGLTHIALSVRDPEKTFRFYQSLIGCIEVYRGDEFIQAQTPGTRDVLVFQLDAERPPGSEGGIAHFGFRLHSADDIGTAAKAVVGAGGRIISMGEFCPGEPYLFFEDLDGYTVELWYELPTPFDPGLSNEERATDIRFVPNPELTEPQLDALFAEAWGDGAARGYERVLKRSLCYFGAFHDNELVGFVNVGWDGGAHAFILDTIVRASVRRRGIGLELVRRAIDAARDAGVEWIHVDYEPHLDEFYGKAGLRPTKARLLHLKSAT